MYEAVTATAAIDTHEAFHASSWLVAHDANLKSYRIS